MVNETNWKDARINDMNRIVADKFSKMPKQENIFLDEYTAIISSDCKDYKSFKKQWENRYGIKREKN